MFKKNYFFFCIYNACKYWQCIIVSYLVSSYGLKLSFKKDCTPLCHIGVVTHSSSQENILHPPCPSLCLWCYVNAIIVVTYAMQTGLFPKNFPDGNPQFWERKWKKKLSLRVIALLKMDIPGVDLNKHKEQLLMKQKW